MSETIRSWHHRFVQQTNWTRNLARYLFQKIKPSSSQLILEVGCGTGAVIQEFLNPLPAHCFGLDINPEYLNFTSQEQPTTRLILGDAHQLPLADGSFDVCVCHYLLLWVTDPGQVAKEMCRVTRPGGVVMALAEPDYGGRIDFPQELSLVGEWQRESLLQQGADPLIGRKLRALFSKSGLIDVEAGVLGGEWKTGAAEAHASEWAILRADLADNPPRFAQLEVLADTDILAWEHGERILYVPTFYAWGRVP